MIPRLNEICISLLTSVFGLIVKVKSQGQGQGQGQGQDRGHDLITCSERCSVIVDNSR